MICYNCESVLSKKHRRFKFFTFNLCVNTLVAAKSKSNILCQSIFENPILKYALPGGPLSSGKLTACFIICYKMEDDFELYTLKEFHEAIEKLGDDIYSWNMIKLPKLTITTP